METVINHPFINQRIGDKEVKVETLPNGDYLVAYYNYELNRSILKSASHIKRAYEYYADFVNTYLTGGQ